MIKVVSVCPLHLIPNHGTSYRLYITDKIIFMDKYPNIIYPFYLLGIKICRMINLKFSITNDIGYYLFHNMLYIMCVFSMDGNKY